jgi:Ca2+-binding RTX toxin-like protein
MASNLELAQLSLSVYNEQTHPLPSGWETCPGGYYIDPKTGFYGQAYRNMATHEIVLAIRGTNDWLSGDAISDAEILIGQRPPQFDSVLDFYKSAIKNNSENTDGYTISITGHSLGGADAQYLGAKILTDVYDTDKYRLSSVVTFDAPGIASCVQSEIPVYLDAFDERIVNCITMPDVVGMSGEHLGRREYYASDNATQDSIGVAITTLLGGAGWRLAGTAAAAIAEGTGHDLASLCNILQQKSTPDSIRYGSNDGWGERIGVLRDLLLHIGQEQVAPSDGNVDPIPQVYPEPTIDIMNPDYTYPDSPSPDIHTDIKLTPYVNLSVQKVTLEHQQEDDYDYYGFLYDATYQRIEQNVNYTGSNNADTISVNSLYLDSFCPIPIFVDNIDWSTIGPGDPIPIKGYAALLDHYDNYDLLSTSVRFNGIPYLDFINSYGHPAWFYGGIRGFALDWPNFSADPFGNDKIIQPNPSIIDGGGGNDCIVNHSLTGCTLIGGDGNDTLEGGQGGDTLVGGHGDDQLYGYGSTYIYHQGDGNDLISEKSDVGGTVKMEGISLSDLVRTKNNNGHLVLAKTDEKLDYYGRLTFVFDNATMTGEELQKYLAVYGTNNSDYLGGTNGNDNINGYAGDDYLDGSCGGNDTLNGGGGNDVLVSGQNSTLLGGSGNDWNIINGNNVSVIWGRGDGNDILVNKNSTDNTFHNSLNFNLLKQDEVRFITDGDDLLFRIADTEESIRLSGWLKTPYISSFNFSDGVVSDNTMLKNIELVQLFKDYVDEFNSGISSFPSVGDNPIVSGGLENDVLFGGDGNDNLHGGPGADTLVGGKGNDYLEGGYGADTYVWSRGAGNDTINNYNTTNSADTLQFQNIALSAFEFTKSGTDLLCTFTESSESVRIANWSLGSNYQVDLFKFSDTTVTAADISQKIKM